MKEQSMTLPALFLALCFVGVTIFLFSQVTYWQERRNGRTHEASLNESAVLSIFLLGSAAIEYAAVVTSYS
jgi:hypothetical protein